MFLKLIGNQRSDWHREKALVLWMDRKMSLAATFRKDWRESVWRREDRLLMSYSNQNENESEQQ